MCIQWNPSIRTRRRKKEESVIYREVSLFQGLKCMQEWYLGRQKVSLLERCPQFRGVLIEGFYCNSYYICCCVCRELLEMRCRLYLNLGLVHENSGDLHSAKKFMEKALSISKYNSVCIIYVPTVFILQLFHSSIACR